MSITSPITLPTTRGSTLEAMLDDDDIYMSCRGRKGWECLCYFLNGGRGEKGFEILVWVLEYEEWWFWNFSVGFLTWRMMERRVERGLDIEKKICGCGFWQAREMNGKPVGGFGTRKEAGADSHHSFYWDDTCRVEWRVVCTFAVLCRVKTGDTPDPLLLQVNLVSCFHGWCEFLNELLKRLLKMWGEWRIRGRYRKTLILEGLKNSWG